MYPIKEINNPVNNPTINNNPISTSRIAAAAKGPGVGGTKTCAEYSPVARHTARIIIFLPDTSDTSLIIEDIKINAASQKTGIDIINPSKFKVRGILFNPNHAIRELTIFFVEPVSCKTFPKIVPANIIGPTPIIIFLKPSNKNDKLFKNEIFKNKPDNNPAVSNVI